MYDYYRKCLKCGSKKILIGFGINNRGEAYKTCENCRIKDRVNRGKDSPNRERYIEEHTNYLNKDNDN